MINGIINIKKEKGFTSHDVVAKMRGILRQKKIGHTGTLDPDAEGVLPVCLGKATRLCDMIGDWDKTYEATLLLGKTTDTEDISGKILEERQVQIKEEELRRIIQSFVGEYNQIPPMYSAKKVKGKKLYELAREGIVIERQPCPVTVFSIQIKKISLPYVRFEVNCSKGTYIRSLCRDIGEKAGCGGCMSALARTKVSVFRIEDAITLSQVEKLRDEGVLDRKIMPIDSVFALYPAVSVSADAKKLLYNGNPVPWGACSFYQRHWQEPNQKNSLQEDNWKKTAEPTKKENKLYAEKSGQNNNLYRVYDKDGYFIGVYFRDDKKDMIRPWKLFFDCPDPIS